VRKFLPKKFYEIDPWAEFLPLDVVVLDHVMHLRLQQKQPIVRLIYASVFSVQFCIKLGQLWERIFYEPEGFKRNRTYLLIGLYS
jgi:hypothetical protein